MGGIFTTPKVRNLAIISLNGVGYRGKQVDGSIPRKEKKGCGCRGGVHPEITLISGNFSTGGQRCPHGMIGTLCCLSCYFTAPC